MTSTLQTHRQDRAVAEHPRGGFSLIEVTIALGILAIGVLSMTAGQLASLKLSGDSNTKTVAMSLAQQQIETFLTMTPAAILAMAGTTLVSDIDPNPGDSDEHTYDRRSIIEADTPEVGVIRMTVEVDWVDNLGRTRTARLQTFKADS